MNDPFKAMEFALANRTGDGFSGSLGFLSANELAVEAELPDRQAKAVLDTLVEEGKILTDGRGGYSGSPTTCVLCSETPCKCGLGSWRLA